MLRPQFRGAEQHDAQEVLSFLLDGLSEDLNLVWVNAAVGINSLHIMFIFKHHDFQIHK